MIFFRELIDPEEFERSSKDVQFNIQQLHWRMNVLRRFWGQPMLITSGYRTMDKHLSVYESINDKRLNAGKRPLKVPYGSMHLHGAACDVSDSQRKLQKFLLENVKILENHGLWCEHFDATETWVHFQILPPMSGERFFKP